MITIRTNLPEFKARLDEIKKQVRTKLVRSAVAAAARSLAKSVRQSVPIGKYKGTRIGGVLRRSIYAGKTKTNANGATGFVSAYSGQKHQSKKRYKI